jgi:hypothetical protein
MVQEKQEQYTLHRMNKDQSGEATSDDKQRADESQSRVK